MAALTLAGCSLGSDGGDEADGADRAAAGFSTEGLPEPLAANVERATEIVDEGTEALDAKLAELKGFPVVVNQWASWCVPCRTEFPFLRDSANQHRGEVAFLGIDMQDDRGAAETFLAELPVPYPHIWDPDGEAAGSLGGGVVFPTTFFIDEGGEVQFVFQGSYSTQDQLETDIEENLLPPEDS